jgi:type I restriction enzyme S subunit
MTLLKDFPVGIAMRDIAFNQDIKALIAKPGVDPLFLLYLLASNKNGIRQLVNTAGHGTGRLDTEQLKAYPVNLPAVNEQTKIAQTLSTWDKAIETTEKLIENSKEQQKALMQQLLTRKRRLSGCKIAWKKKQVKDLVEIHYGKSPKEIVSEFGVYPVTGTGGVTSYTNTAMCHVPSVVIGRKGTIDNPQIIHTPFWAIDTTFYCVPKENCDIEWFYYIVKSLPMKKYNEASGVPSLSRETLYGISILVPTLSEQTRIAQILKTNSAEVDLLEKQLFSLLMQKKALMQQLLTGKRRVKLDNSKAAKGAV